MGTQSEIERDRRLAEALRANLRKRKEAARTRSDTADAAKATAPTHSERDEP